MKNWYFFLCFIALASGCASFEMPQRKVASENSLDIVIHPGQRIKTPSKSWVRCEAVEPQEALLPPPADTPKAIAAGEEVDTFVCSCIHVNYIGLVRDEVKNRIYHTPVVITVPKDSIMSYSEKREAMEEKCTETHGRGSWDKEINCKQIN